MKPLSKCRLYTFVDTAYLGGPNSLEVAQQLCDGGSDLIAASCQEVVWGRHPPDGRSHPAVNDAPAFGSSSMPPRRAEIARRFVTSVRRLLRRRPHPSVATQPSLPPGVKVGLSTHSPHRPIGRSLRAPFTSRRTGLCTGTKPEARPVTLEFCSTRGGPVSPSWFAIGGITLRNLDDVLAAGARRICVVSASYRHPISSRLARRSSTAYCRLAFNQNRLGIMDSKSFSARRGDSNATINDSTV